MTEMTFGNFRDDEDPADRPQAPTLTSGQPVVTMTLDAGRLPVDVRLDSQWDRKVSPHELAPAIFQGYIAALWEHDREALEAGRFEQLSSVPSRRTRLLTLLQARTLAQHSDLVNSLLGGGLFVGKSRLLDRWDEPVVTLTADRGTVRTVAASSEWVATAHGDAITSEILYCADELRSARPAERSEGEYDRLSDVDLEQRYTEHLGELARRAASE